MLKCGDTEQKTFGRSYAICIEGVFQGYITMTGIINYNDVNFHSIHYSISIGEATLIKL